MPTKKPRILVTIEQDHYDTLKRHCELTGRSMSSFIAETVSYSVEGLKGINKLLELSANMNDDAISMLKGKLSDAEAVLSHVVPSLAASQCAGVALAACACEGDKENLDSIPLGINKGVSWKEGRVQRKKSALFLASSNDKKGVK